MAIFYNITLLIKHCRSSGKLSDGVVQLFSSIAREQHFAKKDHVYYNVSRWKSKRELADYMSENILLNKDGLIVLNKPYGVGAHPPRINPNTPKDVSKDDSYNLQDTLPYIGNALGVDHLIIVKSAEKYSSGVTVLATSEKVISQIKTCQRRAMCTKKLTSKYLGIVLGRPKDVNKSESVKVALSASPDGKFYQPVIYDVRRPQGTKEAMFVNVQYSTLCTSGCGASLVEIKPSTTQWHFIRVYLAHQLAPVLGDVIHGSRVINVMGVPVAVNPFNIRGNTKILNPAVLNHLGLEQGEKEIVPCHIHLQEYTFAGWNRDKSDLTVIAPAPEFFKWTCEQLSLKMKD